MSDTALKRHPIRGGIWGIPTGLGWGLLAVNSQKVSLSITTLVVFAILGIAVGALWASFGPAKKPKGAPPAAAAEQPQPLESPDPYQPAAAPAPLPSPAESFTDGSLAAPPAPPGDLGSETETPPI